MKFSLFIFLATMNVWSFAQKKEAYYDFFWKPCSPENSRYYSIIQKTDSGWLQNDYYSHTKSLQMKALMKTKPARSKMVMGIIFMRMGFPLLLVGEFMASGMVSVLVIIRMA